MIKRERKKEMRNENDDKGKKKEGKGEKKINRATSAGSVRQMKDPGLFSGFRRCITPLSTSISQSSLYSYSRKVRKVLEHM